MASRFLRWLRSVFGGAVESLENPEKILQQNIRDLNDQIPAMNENIAMVKANANMAEAALKKLRDKEQQLRANIKSALTAGQRDLALNLATAFEQVQADIVSAEGNQELAQRSFEKAKRVKDAFMVERERKIKEALRAIELSKQAEWQTKIAKTMETFEIADVDQTHDEMVRRIEEKVAKAQARVEMALESKGTQTLEDQEAVRKLQANETLKQFEIELGMTPTEPQSSEKTLGPRETTQTAPAESAEPPASSKTMGKEKA